VLFRSNVGELALYDATGQPVTSGGVSDPLAAFAAADDVVREGDSFGSLFAYAVDEDLAAGAWSGLQVSSTDAFTGPSAISGIPSALAGKPLAATEAGDYTVADLVAAYPSDTGVYELRLRTSSATAAVGDDYAALRIEVNGSTWALEGQEQTVTATTTALATPTAGKKVGETVTLSATVSPAAAGTVVFTAGGQALAAVPVTGGVATADWVPTSAGAQQVTAVFTPLDPAAFGPSTGDPITYTVLPATPQAVTTSTTVTANPAGLKVGEAVTLTATVSPAAAGTVTFTVNGAPLGGTSAVSGGVATRAWVPSAAGTFTIAASFAPTDTAAYTASTATGVSYVVAPAVQVTPEPTPTQTVTPAPAPKTLKVVNPKPKGVLKVGKTLTTTVKVPAGAKAKFQWYTGNKAIKKATKKSLKLARAQKGKTIKVKITITKAGFKTVTKTVTFKGKVK
jgi:hypothetical protein